MTAWCWIEGFEHLYQVSDDGQVRSWHTGTPRLLAAVPDARGYRSVHLFKGGVRTATHVHRLVALAFIGPRPVDAEVRHLNGDPLDNHVANLRYGTRSENARDAVLHGTHRNTAKTRCGRGHAFNAANTYLTPSGRRNCRSCRKAAKAVWDERHRAERRMTAPTDSSTSAPPVALVGDPSP